MAISRVKMRPVDSQLQLPLASREQSRACSVVQVLVGRWASRMSGKYPTLQTGGGTGAGGGGVRDISLSDQSSGHN